MGLSGGPDSLCLFFVLKELSSEMDFHLHVVHVNHGFRPGAAEEDQAYVEKICKKENVTCRTFIYDCNALAEKFGISIEEAGRRVRYEAFYQTAVELPVQKENVKIAVAQNADDQAETVLFRLLRGTGTDGLAGIDYCRMEKDISVIRPLLDVWRRDIEEYCRQKDLLPRIDKTNLQLIYTRNQIRLGLLPYLKENFNPNIMETLTRLSATAREDKEFLWEQAEKTYESLKIAEGILPQDELRALPKAIRHRVMMRALAIKGLTQDVSRSHLEAADRVLGSESKVVEFPAGYRMIVRYGEVVFCKQEQEAAPASLKVLVTENPDIDVSRAAVFDYNKIVEVYGENFRVELRTRREGDYISIKNGRKKIQNLFVDEKVPRENRNQVQFAAIGSEILWIMEQPLLGISKPRYNPRYKLDNKTKNRLILEIICDI